MGPAQDKSTAPLNEHQTSYLLATFRHIDGLLSHIEAILDCGRSRSAFPQYIVDFDEQVRSDLERKLETFRAAMVAILKRQHIDVPAPRFAALNSIASAVTFIELAADDLRPEHMRGYGEVSDGTKDALAEIVSELTQLANDMGLTIRMGRGQVA